jgi:hypothetical protein
MNSKKRNFQKTRVLVEVLHEGPLAFQSLADLHDLITDGDASGNYTVKSVDLNPKKMADEAIKQGSDPEFFGIDADGNNTQP